MRSFKAIVLMAIWTGIVGYVLFKLGAHDSDFYKGGLTGFLYALAVGITLLIVHLVNIAVYFKITGEKPFQWFK